MESIIFDHVYPLYAVSDIRSSSHLRNLAILNDLWHHMEIIEEILEKANSRKELPVLDEMLFRIRNHKKAIHDSLCIGDELEDMQGIHGLRALRVKVNLDNPQTRDMDEAIEQCRKLALAGNGLKMPEF